MFPIPPRVPECAVHFLLSSPAAPWGGCLDLNCSCRPFCFTSTSVQRMVHAAGGFGFLYFLVFFWGSISLPEDIVCRCPAAATCIFVQFLLVSSFYFSPLEFNQRLAAKAWSFRCFLNRSWVLFVTSVRLVRVAEEKMHVAKKISM